MRRKAFLDNYEQHAMFKDDLGEFEDSREIVESLAEEYKAAESPECVATFPCRFCSLSRPPPPATSATAPQERDERRI